MANHNYNIEYLSKEGFEKLREELRILSNERRRKIAERLEYAKSLGDLSENAEYQQAKEDQTSNEMRIAELENILQGAEIIQKSSADTVEVGAKVVAEKSETKAAKRGVCEFLIVGSEEADPAANKISHESPIGRAFLGKKKGEEVNVLTLKGAVYYKILDIL
ncbi:MAG: transcription elongation factor GreA [Candidatus Niyogibacteria bacterium]|nr:transcription elongation factor GreA [Candidatus Niyogibacteria bacterium]